MNSYQALINPFLFLRIGTCVSVGCLYLLIRIVSSWQEIYRVLLMEVLSVDNNIHIYRKLFLINMYIFWIFFAYFTKICILMCIFLVRTKISFLRANRCCSRFLVLVTKTAIMQSLSTNAGIIFWLPKIKKILDI